MKPTYIRTNESLTLAWPGEEPITITAGAGNFQTCVDLLNSGDYDRLKQTIVTPHSAQVYLGSDFTVERGYLLYHGKTIGNLVASKVVEFMAAGLPAQPLINFTRRLLQNPLQAAIADLYRFLEHNNLPITERGTFLGYKGVRNDYKDIYTGRFDNSLGNTITMDLDDVEWNPEVACSRGLHVGTLEYAAGYASGGRLIIVEVCPSNVVSVPFDHDSQKLRTREYTVLEDYEGPLPELYDDRNWDGMDEDWFWEPSPDDEDDIEEELLGAFNEDPYDPFKDE